MVYTLLYKLPEDKDWRLLCAFQAHNPVMGNKQVLSVELAHLVSKGLKPVPLTH